MIILTDTFSPEQKEIVKQICYIQLNSLRRIYNNKHHSDNDIIMMLIENDIDEESFKNKIEEKLESFKELSKNPNKLGKLKNNDLSVFRHLLSQIEDEYKDKYPKAISRLWEVLFIFENIKTPQSLN